MLCLLVHIITMGFENMYEIYQTLAIWSLCFSFYLALKRKNRFICTSKVFPFTYAVLYFFSDNHFYYNFL